PVAGQLRTAPGLLLALGIGEAPVGVQGTFSLWRSSGALHDFAYRCGTAHAEVVRRTPTSGWYAEELFARFAVLDVRGTIDGRTPA
ncbi:MAG TPA: monooxygenase, partial [Mycobacteriales bacterium]|nr:monooxygenase [Mycobacteriales bacterium]